jgi:hypothetical protein
MVLVGTMQLLLVTSFNRQDRRVAWKGRPLSVIVGGRRPLDDESPLGDVRHAVPGLCPVSMGISLMSCIEHQGHPTGS